MALGNGYRNAAADDCFCGSSGRQYLASRRPQPLVDDTGIYPVAKLDRPVGVCIHALAESRQLNGAQRAAVLRRETAALRNFTLFSLDLSITRKLDAAGVVR